MSLAENGWLQLHHDLFQEVRFVLRKIITKDGYRGTDNIVSSEAHKACSGNSGHQNQLMVFPEIVTYLKVRSRSVNVCNNFFFFKSHNANTFHMTYGKIHQILLDYQQLTDQEEFSELFAVKAPHLTYGNNCFHWL